MFFFCFFLFLNCVLGLLWSSHLSLKQVIPNILVTVHLLNTMSYWLLIVECLVVTPRWRITIKGSFSCSLIQLFIWILCHVNLHHIPLLFMVYRISCVWSHQQLCSWPIQVHIIVLLQTIQNGYWRAIGLVWIFDYISLL